MLNQCLEVTTLKPPVVTHVPEPYTPCARGTVSGRLVDFFTASAHKGETKRGSPALEEDLIPTVTS